MPKSDLNENCIIFALNSEKETIQDYIGKRLTFQSSFYVKKNVETVMHTSNISAKLVFFLNN